MQGTVTPFIIDSICTAAIWELKQGLDHELAPT